MILYHHSSKITSTPRNCQCYYRYYYSRHPRLLRVVFILLQQYHQTYGLFVSKPNRKTAISAAGRNVYCRRRASHLIAKNKMLKIKSSPARPQPILRLSSTALHEEGAAARCVAGGDAAESSAPSLCRNRPKVGAEGSHAGRTRAWASATLRVCCRV